MTPHEPHRSPSGYPFRIAFVAASLVAAVIVTFFLIGVGDGSVSSFNIALWLGLLGATGVVLIGGRSLHARGHRKAAIALLGVLALPGLLYAFFMLVVIASGARWN